MSSDAPAYPLDARTGEQIARSFTYHPPDSGDPPVGGFPTQVARYNLIRDEAGALARLVATSCPPSRERSLAITNLEQAVFWSSASIARNE